MYSLIGAAIGNVKIDAKHGIKEAVVPVTEVKPRYGNRLALLGGMGVDVLARSTLENIPAKLRVIFKTRVLGDGFFLGSGNWMTNYIPPENYLAMLCEGRRFQTKP